MRCKRISYIYSLATFLAFPFFVSSAPSENRMGNSKQFSGNNVGEVKQFAQANPSAAEGDGNDSGWYPTIDIPGELGDADYAADTKQMKAMAEKASKKSRKKNASSSKGNSDFKTFCEDDNKSGNCTSSDSSSIKKTLGQEQSCEQIISEMKGLTSNQNKLETKDVTRLRELIENLSKKSQELQQRAAKCDARSGGGKSLSKGTKSRPSESTSTGVHKQPQPQGPISEIEEKRIVERKFIKANDHSEDQRISNVVQILEEKPEKSLQTTRLPTKIMAPPPPVALSSYQRNYKEGSNFMLTSPPDNGINYLEAAADVNYNGGINRPMDSLKRQHPEGHWPDQHGDSEEVVNSSVFVNNKLQAESAEGYNIDESNYEEYEGAQPDISDYNLRLDINSSLTPEYLERIIQTERRVPPKINKKIQPFHHVQEHTT